MEFKYEIRLALDGDIYRTIQRDDLDETKKIYNQRVRTKGDDSRIQISLHVIRIESIELYNSDEYTESV